MRAQNALEALMPQEREVLVLWNAGMSYVEITERTGLPLEVVGVILAQARKRLLMVYDFLVQ